MTITTQLRLRDFLQFNYRFIYRHRAIVVATVAGTLMLLWALLYYAGVTAVRAVTSYQPLFQLIFGLLTTLFPVVLYWQTRRMYSRDPRFSAPITYEFDQDGYRVQGASFRGRVPWRLVERLEETDDLFFFYRLGTLSSMLPKRDIPAGLLAEFRALVRDVPGTRWQ